MQRVLTALTAPTAEGILYEADTRLRPAGPAGPLAVRFEGFSSYQREQAWTWEHMSLISSRVISPESPLKSKLEKEIKGILARKRNPQKLLRDVMDMRARVEKKFSAKDPWNLKYRHGGMMDILFIAHYLTLRQSGFSPAADVSKCLQQLVNKNGLTKKDGRVLIEAYELFYAIESFLRLTAEKPFVPDKSSDGLKGAMAQSVLKGEKAKTFRALEKRMETLAKGSAVIYGKIFIKNLKKPNKR
jgi:glutamate-ammonia-ligase adenylyltransferase